MQILICWSLIVWRKSLEDCSFNYKRAIQACLDTPWTAAGERVGLDNPVVVSGMYEDVIRPLEEDENCLYFQSQRDPGSQSAFRILQGLDLYCTYFGDFEMCKVRKLMIISSSSSSDF